LTDAGLTFRSQLIEAAIGGLTGNSYQTILTTVKKKGGWFSKGSTEEYYNTILSGLDSETKRQFELILSNLYDTVLTAGDALGIAADKTKSELSDFYVNIGKISLNGKTGEQIQDTLTAIFGKIGDDLARDAFPILEQFQKIGEGFFETVSRVATDVQVVSKTLNKIGVDISSNQIIISESLIGLSGSLSDFYSITSDYYDSFFTDAEKLDDTTRILGTVFSELNVSAPKTYEEFRKIVESLDLNTINGQETYITLMKVSGSFRDVAESALNSQNNIYSWIQRNETLDETLQRLADTLGVSVNATFEELISGLGGLTDAELEFLQARESAQKDALDLLSSIIDKLRGAASGSNSSLQKYYSSMKETQALSSDITDSAFVESLNKTIGFASALFDGSNFSYNRDMVFAQSVAANQFEGMKSSALEQIDYLRLIEENTRNELVSLSTGTVPSFAVGTSSVPYNMQANIHRGEIIVPRDFSDGIRSGDLTMGSNGDMSNKLDRNNAIMSEILRTLKDGNDINNASLEVLEDLERIA
jgi:hypothetical protein